MIGRPLAYPHGMSEPSQQESDQLPEEHPAGDVVDDDQKSARKDAKETAGVPGESGQGEGQASGNPANAG